MKMLFYGAEYARPWSLLAARCLLVLILFR